MANPPKSPQFDWEMYRYIPSLIGAIISIIIFAVLALVHFWQWLKLRNHIVICVVLGSLCEVGGYGARIGSHFDNTAWAPFIVQETLLLVGPLFFAATTYMMLARTIRLAGGENVSLIRPSLYTKVFVGADISTLLLQGFGASIMGTMKLNLALAGEKIVIAGLALQVATFVIFLMASIDFRLRMNRKISSFSAHIDTAVVRNNWKKMLWCLYSVSLLILFRCIFRLVEYAMGNAGYLIAHEWTLYVFDTVPMVQVLLLLLWLE